MFLPGEEGVAIYDLDYKLWFNDTKYDRKE